MVHFKAEFKTGEDVKKKLRFLREERLSPHEVKPDGFVDHLFAKKNGRGERSAEPSSVISLFQQIYPLKYAFYLWSTLWSSYCFCDLPNIAHFQQKSNGNSSLTACPIEKA